MTSDQKKFEHLAGCELLAQNSSTPEQRESLLDLAHKWRAMATSQNLYEVAPRDSYRYAVTAWLKGLHLRPRF